VGLTVTGPASATTVKSLTINASGPNPAELKLQSSGPITASDGVTLGAKGRLTGSGQISGIFNGAGGSVIRPDGDMAMGSLSEAGFSTAGTLTVGSHTVTLQSSDGAWLGGNTTLNGGKLVASTINNNGALSGNGEIDAVLANNGQINLIGQEMTFHRRVNNTPGVGQIAGRNAIMHFDGDLNNEGSMAFSFGTSDVFGKVNNVTDGRIVVSGNSQVTFYDDVDNNGIEIRVSTGSTAVFFGAVSGASPFTGSGTKFFEGDLRPGNSPAAVHFEGDVGFGSSASLVMELAGILPGTEYDKVSVADSLILGGRLDVQLIDGFVPKAGDTFDLLDWAKLVGQFDAVHLPTLPNGLVWNATSLYTTGEIGVVPEPGTLVLLVTAGLVALSYAWRRRRS